MGRTQINPRLLMIAAAAALVVALLTLATHSFVVSAMSWLAFEILAILSAIFLTTPVGSTVHVQERTAAPQHTASHSTLLATQRHIAKMYDSPVDPAASSGAETVIRDDAA